MPGAKKRVLIADDSVFARRIISDIINASPDLEVIGTVTNGREVLLQVENLRPDVITLDVEMPKLDGIETLRRLMKENPTPVVMLSSLTVRGAKESVEALRLGAVDIMAKPGGSHSLGLSAYSDELIAKILAAANVDPAVLKPFVQPRARPTAQLPVLRSSTPPVVIIASSTGGPRAIRAVVPRLTDAAAYLIVQHLPEGFSGPMAQDIDGVTDCNVREASDGDGLHSGDVLFAKAGYHCVFDRASSVRLTRDPPLWGVRPAADITIASAAPVFGSRLIGVVLTGMGRDGADGMRLIKEAGGTTIAEHESSCVVYGMPRVAIESGIVDVVAPLQRMADAINASVSQVSRTRHGRKRSSPRAA